MALRRNSQLLAALTLLTILTWLGWSFRGSDSVQVQPVTTEPDSQEQTPIEQTTIQVPTVVNATLRDGLCEYGVCDISSDADITYSRLNVEVRVTKKFEPPLLQDISFVFPPPQTLSSLDMLQLQRFALNQRTTVEVPPIPLLPDASNLILGVATNIDRLEASLAQFSHWASKNGAHIIALVPNTSAPADIDRTFGKSLDLNLYLTIRTSGMEFDDRYFHLATLMSEYSNSLTTWAAFIDDDTFFPSMTALQSLLSNYRAPKSRPYYIGALSEDFHQLFKWGMMAYGGGGVFISMALLNKLVPHLSTCAQLQHTGDARLAQCIFSHTTTKLIPQPGLFQIDLWGDASGFYEALRPQPVSVHHWKSWHNFDMVNASRVSAICGDACIFQKYKFSDDWQLTNGFSLVKYSQGNERASDDERMEKTWLDSQGGTDDMFLHSVAPLKPKDENKIQYLLEGSVLDQGVVRQFYVRRSIQEDDKPLVQIVEVTWTAGNNSV